ncbi:MAG TPA: hypothetical protein VFW28_20330 [Micropepsaceae bacterium]|nr:hypothetical protein [Micropepsaceae bacterium]
MTDVTQAGVISREIGTSRPAAVAARPSYLFGPVFDFMTLGGASLIVCAAIAFLLPKGIPGTQQAILVTVLMTIINQPHFAHSYQMFYRNYREKAFGASYPAALRWRYISAGLVVPAILVAFLAGAALAGSAHVLAYGANAMFFLVGWHYVKQGYGILIVDSVQKRLMFSDRAKLVLRANGYASWMVAWLAVNHAFAGRNYYIGLTYFSLPIPTLLYQLSIAALVVTSAATLVVLAQRWREARGQLPWIGLVAYVTTLYLWVIFVRINPLVLAVVPTFHSLQYLAVVWRYQLNAAERGAAAAAPALFSRLLPANWSSFAFFTGVGVLLGYLGFQGVPRSIDALLPYDKHLLGPSLFLFSFYIFINIHHYFLDNVMWRRGNPDVQQYIFAKAAKPAP